MTKHSDDIREVGRLSFLLEKIIAIRNDLEAPAPKHWRDLYDKTPSDAVWQRGLEVVRAEMAKVVEARKRKEAEDKQLADKINETIRLLTGR